MVPDADLCPAPLGKQLSNGWVVGRRPRERWAIEGRPVACRRWLLRSPECRKGRRRLDPQARQGQRVRPLRDDSRGLLVSGRTRAIESDD